jgi:hypothetical protein|tara:strand:- start:52 stop:339 length:288 start_codon:yes stop_codon:yes gene_type:complete
MTQIKVDNYTKGTLTIIAVCLTVLTLKQVDIIPKAYANAVENNIMPLNTNYGLVPVNEDGSITVKLSSSSVMDVNIEEVNRYAFRYCTIPVEIQD